MRKDFERLFDPRAIAIIGASRDLDSISGQPLHHLVAHHYRGAVYPVNPKYPDILGIKCYPSIEALPETPDLAMIVINAARVAEALRQCGKKGVPYAIVLSAGYAETGNRGVALQRELVVIASEYDIGIVGPNCQGLVNVTDRVYAGFSSIFYSDHEPGTVSMVSQSGGFGFSVMNLVSKMGGLNYRHMVTTGNEIGITSLDFIDHFIDDPQTEIIAGYIEGLRDAHRLIDIGRKALSKRKPILAWKVGNTDEGRQAAAAHTANLGGTMALYRAAFYQGGIIQIEDIQDLIDYGRAFRCGKLPEGNRLAIITITGGAGILMTDECVGHGMWVPPLAPATLAKLRDFVPAFGSLANPIDVTAAIFNDPDLVKLTVRAVLEDPGIDSIAIINASVRGELGVKIASEIAALAREAVKPIFMAWSALDETNRDAYALLDAAHVPHYKSPVRCGRALAALSWYAEAVRRDERVRAEPVPAISSGRAREKLAGRSDDVSEYAAKEILAQYGVPVTREALATSRDEALSIARRLGYPVALKVQSPDIPHKTEAGAVRLALASDAEVAAAYDEIIANARAHRAEARIEGVLVQEMVTGGIEAILGVTNDPLFGPAVMFGLGGVFVEVLQDVAFRIAPVTKSAALEMIAGIKGYPVLAGARGAAHADIDALADAIVRLSALALDLRDCVAALDINPLFVFARGQGVKAGDALIKRR